MEVTARELAPSVSLSIEAKVRVAAMMVNDKDFDFRRADYLVVDLMWKSTEQTTPDHASNAWERLRVSGDPLNIFMKFFEEFNGHCMSCLGLVILQDFGYIFSCE